MSVKRLGLPWLIALVILPLLLAAIGHAVSTRSPSGRGSPAPSTGAGAPTISLAAFSIVRNGSSVTLTGEFPDESAKAALLKVLNSALPAPVGIVDRIRIDPAVDALDFAKAKPVFADGAAIADFTLTVGGDTITLAGTAASPDQKDTIDTDAKRIWSNLNVVDNLAINSPPASPGAAASCTNLQSAINTLTDGALTFESNLGSLTASDEQVLTRVAEKLRACPNVHVAINGYADSTGNTSLNVPLSEQRAQTVAGFLQAHGVPGDRLTTTGFGSADPIAPNGTDDGRAQNRRVEIVVSRGAFEHGLHHPVVVVPARFPGGLGRRLDERHAAQPCAAMSHVNWWLFGLSFALGLVLTLALMMTPAKSQARAANSRDEPRHDGSEHL